nr:uncharacterized protein LOC105860859 [Microcebus murinus]
MPLKSSGSCISWRPPFPAGGTWTEPAPLQSASPWRRPRALGGRHSRACCCVPARFCASARAPRASFLTPRKSRRLRLSSLRRHGDGPSPGRETQQGVLRPTALLRAPSASFLTPRKSWRLCLSSLRRHGDGPSPGRETQQGVLRPSALLRAPRASFMTPGKRRLELFLLRSFADRKSAISPVFLKKSCNLYRPHLKRDQSSSTTTSGPTRDVWSLLKRMF